MKNITENSDATAMRRYAEQTLKQRENYANGTLADHDIHEQLHEPQISQIELAVQNDALAELDAARREIAAGLKRYTELFDFAPVGYVTLDRYGTLSDINLTCAKLLGVERDSLIGRRMATFVAIKSQAKFKDFLTSVFGSDALDVCEVELVRADGLQFYSRIKAIVDLTGNTCRVVMTDITQRKLIEGTAIKAHEQLEARVLERTVELVYANEHLRFEIEGRKRAEKELQQSQAQLRQLTIHQESVKEGERKRIAREIHDDLGQNLLALRIDVSLLHTRTARAHPKLHERAGATLKIIDASMKSVRTIINNLRPTTLDIGLQAAIEWQMKEFERRSGIRCTLQVDQNNFDFSLDEKIATGVFRVLQESLTNVSRHANATTVHITLQRDDDRLFMRVVDNGIGMRPGCRRKSNSFGLMGIQERISQMGGVLTIGNVEQGAGTSLSISIPLAG